MIARLRLPALLLACAWILVTPGVAKWTRTDLGPFRAWDMFSGFGLAATQVAFVQALPDGTKEPIDRYDLLATNEHERAALAHVKDKDAALAIARRLCRHLGPTADVRVRLDVATRAGWHRVLRETDNQCR